MIPLSLDATQIRQFQCQGFIVLPDLFSPTEISAMNTRLSEIAQACDPMGHSPLPGVKLEFEAGSQPGHVDGKMKELLIRKYLDLGQADPFFWDNLRDPRVRIVLDALIGPGAQLLQCMALVKPPQIGGAKDWHQDIAYFPLTPAAAIGVWIACDDADLGNGCMQVVPGSHLSGIQEHEQGPTGWKLTEQTVTLRANDIVALPMTAGSALFFDSGLWHFTGRNSSERRRRAIQYHYVAQETRISPERTLWNLDASQPPRLASTSGVSK